MSSASMHRQVLILTVAQALYLIASVMVMTVGGLAGARIAPSPSLATLPIAAIFLGTAVGMFPASMWMARVGRRAGFMAGALLGTAGGLLAALGIWQGSLLLLSSGTFLMGANQAFAQFYRFAASEVADASFRPRAISLVMAGGVVAALVGPGLARLGVPLLPTDYAGSFLIMALVSLAATGVLIGLGTAGPAKAVATLTRGRPWKQIVAQPRYLAALFGAATGYGVMILAMTATPLAMVQHHHELATTATVIQLHVLGMFLPSFFTGHLITRFGVLKVMMTGVALLAGHIFLTMSGTGFNSFASALVLLGVGWNFLYVGGTTLLTQTYSAEEKAQAQATNDMAIFVIGLVCSLGAGALLQLLGWERMNVILLPWLAAAAAALAWLGLRSRRQPDAP